MSFKCESCNQEIRAVSKEQFEMHLKPCKMYKKYFKSTGKKFEFQCNICNEKHVGNINMYRHMKEKHFNGKSERKNASKIGNNSRNVLKKSVTKKCDSCSEIIQVASSSSFDLHYKSCTIYKSYYKKIDNFKFECQCVLRKLLDNQICIDTLKRTI